MSTTPCPRCGTDGDGNFCSSCGAALRGPSCPECASPLVPGQRFCTECGTPAPESAMVSATQDARHQAAGGQGDDGRPADLGWWVAGGLFVGLLLLVAYPTVFATDDGQDPDAAMAQGGSAGEWSDPEAGLGPAPNVDLSGMTTREAADALFDRSMDALSVGDSAQVALFLPKAIEAYQEARPLDADGHFHLSLLQRVGFQFEEALATAEEALEEDPDHLLNLWAAASAAADQGETEVAEEYYARLLEAWEDELERGRPEYEAHQPLMETLDEEAREFLEPDA